MAKCEICEQKLKVGELVICDICADCPDFPPSDTGSTDEALDAEHLADQNLA